VLGGVEGRAVGVGGLRVRREVVSNEMFSSKNHHEVLDRRGRRARRGEAGGIGGTSLAACVAIIA